MIEHKSFAIINESGAEPSSCQDAAPEGNISSTATALQSPPEERRIQDEPNAAQLPSIKSRLNVSLYDAEDTIINDSGCVSPLSTPSTLPYDKTSRVSHGESNPIIHQVQHTTWHHVPSEDTSPATHCVSRPAAQFTQSPHSIDVFQCELAPLSNVASHDGSSILRPTNPSNMTATLDIQEGCLVRCFVDKLARAVCQANTATCVENFNMSLTLRHTV